MLIAKKAKLNVHDKLEIGTRQLYEVFPKTLINAELNYSSKWLLLPRAQLLLQYINSVLNGCCSLVEKSSTLRPKGPCDARDLVYSAHKQDSSKWPGSHCLRLSTATVHVLYSPKITVFAIDIFHLYYFNCIGVQGQSVRTPFCDSYALN